jgi:PAP2 superfamily
MKKLFILFRIQVICFAGLAQNSSAILTNWMVFHCRLVRQTKDIAHVAYVRHFCYAAIAAYESIVKSDSSYCSLSGQLNEIPQLPLLAQKKLFFPASLNTAYANVLRHFYDSFPHCKAAIDSMSEAQIKNFTKEQVPKQQLEQSNTYGKMIAAVVLQWAENDGANNKEEYIPLKGKDVWTPVNTVAAEPFWWRKRSLTKDLETVYLLQPPLYDNEKNSSFYQMANEVYTTSVDLTPAQKATALYWDDSPNGQYITVFGHWTSILAQLINHRQLPLIEAAMAYAKMTITLHEATILAWKGKYQYNIVRPVTYIQQYIAKGWAPLIATPPHPEFPAAHATFSNAAATALRTLFGDTCAITDNSYIVLGMPERKYASLQEAAKEAGLSRMYGGIHYRYSIDQGFVLGEKIARHVDKALHFLFNP